MLKIYKISIIIILATYGYLCNPQNSQALNINNQPLAKCSDNPKTGYYRDGYCNTGPDDTGTHTVCAKVTADFLEFTKSKGNDLSTPTPQYSFPGLKDGDFWCLCALRWREAYENNKAPKIKVNASHKKTLDFVTREILQDFNLQ